MAAFLEERLRFAVEAGIAEELICLDPGIGFGKTMEQNFELVRRLPELGSLGRPLVVGFSRKSSLGRLLGDPKAKTGPLSASVAAAVAAYERGATILRVHDVRRARRGAEGRSGGRRMIVEVHGLEVFGRHGVNDDERRDGQPFLVDVTLGSPSRRRTRSRRRSTTGACATSCALSTKARASGCSRRFAVAVAEAIVDAACPGARHACACASRGVSWVGVDRG